MRDKKNSINNNAEKNERHDHFDHASMCVQWNHPLSFLIRRRYVLAAMIPKALCPCMRREKISIPPSLLHRRTPNRVDPFGIYIVADRGVVVAPFSIGRQGPSFCCAATRVGLPRRLRKPPPGPVPHCVEAGAALIPPIVAWAPKILCFPRGLLWHRIFPILHTSLGFFSVFPPIYCPFGYRKRNANSNIS